MRLMIITLLCMLSTPAAFAQMEENIVGTFHAACGPTDGPAVSIDLSNHVHLIVYGSVKPDEAYRTKSEVFEGEQPSMEVRACDAKGENCKSVEGILTTYGVDEQTIEGAIEYFDGTEVQGDSESLQGKTSYFKALKDKTKAAPACG